MQPGFMGLKRIQCGVLGLLILLALPAGAAELAVLRNGFSIRHERRDVMGANTRLYLGADTSSYVDVPTAEIDHFEKDLSPAPVAAVKPAPQVSVADAVSGSSQRYHLDPDLVNSVIRAESAFNPHAVSRKGAQGLMQLMPQTASRLGVTDAFNPGENVEAGARYLRALMELYNFDLIKALAAYNAGPGRVEQYGGVPPYYETRAYVSRIIRDFNQKKIAEEKQGAAQTAARRHSAEGGRNTP